MWLDLGRVLCDWILGSFFFVDWRMVIFDLYNSEIEDSGVLSRIDIPK